MHVTCIQLTYIIIYTDCVHTYYYIHLHIVRIQVYMSRRNYFVQNGVPTSFSSPVTFFGVWPRSPMPHLFLIAKYVRCLPRSQGCSYLVLKTYSNYDVFDKPGYATILNQIKAVAQMSNQTHKMNQNDWMFTSSNSEASTCRACTV